MINLAEIIIDSKTKLILAVIFIIFLLETQTVFVILGVGKFLFALSVIAQNYFDKRLKKFKDHPLRKVANKSIHQVKKLKFNKENLINQKEHKVFERK